ncbi:MAG: GNAT family N-acetyltransferase [Acidimicrobiia bacterium]|nr:GNAT family N-acetyltransferase [Acidimicrobiia bacterium]
MISVCGRNDLTALEAAFSTGLNRFHERRLAEQESGASTYLVAWLDGVPVGHVHLLARSRYHEVRVRLGDRPEVNALAVAPERRRLGIASVLLDEAERRAGPGPIGLAVEPGNTGAVRLYGGLGYEEWGGGAILDAWDQLDADGAPERHEQVCTYLVKHLR